MSINNSLYIVMPAYNEEKNIEKVVREWYPLLGGKGDSSRLVIADSGSTDLTHDILIKLKEEYPKLVILSDTGKGHGPKLIALYDYPTRCRLHISDRFRWTDSSSGVFFILAGERTLGSNPRIQGCQRGWKKQGVCRESSLFFALHIFWSKGTGCKRSVSFDEDEFSEKIFI